MPSRASGPATAKRCARLPIPARGHRDDRHGPSGASRRACDGSPDTKRRYCQKLSPAPARRRPCRPWITLAAMRRASSTRRGSDAASVRLSPSARRIAVISPLDMPCLCGHQPIRVFNCLITSGMVRPSARAEKVSAMRCLRTGSARSSTSSIEGARRPSSSARARTASISD